MSSGYLLPIGTFAYNSATSFVLITMPDRYIEHDLRGFRRSSLPLWVLPSFRYTRHLYGVPGRAFAWNSFSRAQMKMQPRSPRILTRGRRTARICFYVSCVQTRYAIRDVNVSKMKCEILLCAFFFAVSTQIPSR